jgi:hypothetical protein
MDSWLGDREERWMTRGGQARARVRGMRNESGSMPVRGPAVLRSRWRSVVFLVAAAIATAHAQAPAVNGDRLLVSAGVSHAVERDQRASPLAYSGTGPVVDLAFVHRSDRALLEVGVAGTSRRATSRITQHDLPYERAFTGRVRAEYYRLVSGGTGARTSWFVGGAVRAEATGEDHHYADLDVQTGSYGFGLASLAPAVLWEARFTRGRTISARLSVPVLAVVSHPYFNRGFDVDAPLRTVTVGALRAASGAIQYTQPVGGRTAVVVGYRLWVLNYRDAQAYRRMSQALIASLSLHLGGNGP